MGERMDSGRIKKANRNFISRFPVTQPSMGWYSRVNGETGEVEDKKWRAKETGSKDFWLPVLSDKTFSKWIKERYQVAHGAMMVEEDNVEEVYETIEEGE